MNKIAVIAALGSVFAVSVAQAAGNGTINFTGAVNNQTCNASINGATGTTAAAVTLPTVQANVLAAAGNTAGQTAFKMDVTGCAATNPTGAGTVKAYFEKGPNVDSNGRLINTTTTGASNVALELVDGTGNTAIRAGDISQNTGNYVAITGGNATLPYSVRYYATGAATAGAVTSSVTYSLAYN
ncbi:type 1 fimbrial protein [Citrobacter freundii]|nr:type 1 fimbrial protein [Salmonella enterica subsp. enterica serovar Javiana]ELK1751044.1 type 1 fimbrial protein [Salmonella enterica]POT23843.1 type 1 fimbrial protein [Citrobacter freundii]EEK7952548.1 type 1 fimbrial protein [Salmonella enterica subsp. enterica serovar Javiana]EEK7979890.1 type 1 fimbrial protein [Salmonella enterica subsp. enterica serovar Javiana]